MKKLTAIMSVLALMLTFGFSANAMGTTTQGTTGTGAGMTGTGTGTFGTHTRDMDMLNRERVNTTYDAGTIRTDRTRNTDGNRYKARGNNDRDNKAGFRIQATADDDNGMDWGWLGLLGLLGLAGLRDKNKNITHKTGDNR